MNLALVDDLQSDLEYLQKLLLEYLSFVHEKSCFSLYYSGEEFLSVFYPGKFDAVFLDNLMDGINGMETAGRRLFHTHYFYHYRGKLCPGRIYGTGYGLYLKTCFKKTSCLSHEPSSWTKEFPAYHRNQRKPYDPLSESGRCPVRTFRWTFSGNPDHFRYFETLHDLGIFSIPFTAAGRIRGILLRTPVSELLPGLCGMFRLCKRFHFSQLCDV